MTDMPPYDPTWMSDLGGARAFAVYDEREGFTPAYALVIVDDAGDAAEEAEFVSNGRLAEDSESLVVREVQFS